MQLVGITQTQQVVGINGGLQIFNWLCSLYGTYLVPRVPRRKLLMTAWIGVLFSNGMSMFSPILPLASTLCSFAPALLSRSMGRSLFSSLCSKRDESRWYRYRRRSLALRRIVSRIIDIRETLRLTLYILCSFNLVCGPLFFSMTAEVLSFNIRAKG